MEMNVVKARVHVLDGAYALVEVEQGGCGRCHEEGGCGGQHLTQMFCSGPKTFRVENTCGAIVGDRVTVATSAGSVRRTANLAYVLPLLSAIAGAIIGTFLAGDVGAVLGMLLSLAAAFAWVRLRSRAALDAALGQPHIVSRS